MKKTIILLALAIAAGASCSEAIAKNKKKKNEPAAPVKEIVTLQSKSDSLNYATGQAYTRGLMDYVTSSLGVDSTYVPVFVESLKQALAEEETPEMKAQSAGKQIASMIRDRMIPDLTKQLDGTSCALDINLFSRGFTDAVENDASILSVDESVRYQTMVMTQLKEEKAEAAKAEGKKWLAANAARDDVKVLPSGLQFRIIKQGTGIVAEANDDVTVKYEGKLIDGTVFDSSYKRTPDTTTFKPTQVIKGWTEALCLMPEGSEWELYIPENLAYGERAAGQIPPYSTLIFKVEVVSVKKHEEAKPAEEPAAKPAPKAKVRVGKKK